MGNSIKDYTTKVIGVGGCGHNNIGVLYQWLNKENVGYVIMNSDVQDMRGKQWRGPGKCPTAIKYIQLGKGKNNGLGCGGCLPLGTQFALEDKEKIKNAIKGAEVVFIIAGMGGGIGSGVAPMVAYYAKEAGAVVIGVVTMPFSFEDGKRKSVAQVGLENLKKYADVAVVIDNDVLVKKGVMLSEALKLKFAECAPEITNAIIDGIWKMHHRLECMLTTYSDLQCCIDKQGA